MPRKCIWNISATKETQLLEKERKSRIQYEKQMEEKQRKLKEQKEKDEQRRISAEEKRKQKLQEERVQYMFPSLFHKMPRGVTWHWNTFFLAFHCLSCPLSCQGIQSQFSLPFSGRASCSCALRSLSFDLLSEVKRSLEGLGREPFHALGCGSLGSLRSMPVVSCSETPHSVGRGLTSHSCSSDLSAGQSEDRACSPIWLPLPFCPVHSSSQLCWGPASLSTSLDSFVVWHSRLMSGSLLLLLPLSAAPLACARSFSQIN